MDGAAQRLVDALEMWEDGIQIMRENLRRRSPKATELEIEDALDLWLAGPDPSDFDRLVGGWPRRTAEADPAR